jgi:tetratricopeptide (TPR) repeat protein
LKGYIEPYVARNFVSLGQVLAVAGQTQEAEKSYRKAVNLLDRLVKQSPESALPRVDLAQTLAGLANLLTEPERRPEAEGLRRRVIQLYETLRANSPEDPSVNNELAWFLATNPEPRLRDAAQAVRLAQKAVAAEAQSANYRNTLGVAHHRNGDDRAAVAELETAMNLGAGGSSLDWFFLAMAHWRLGNRDQARTWFDRAVQGMDSYKSQDDELRRFRAEAETMLVEGKR